MDYRTRWQRQRRRQFQTRVAMVVGGLVVVVLTMVLVRCCGSRGPVWTYRPPTQDIARLCIGQDKVYVAWADGAVKVLNLHTGQDTKLIDFSRPSGFQAVPVVVGDCFIIGGEDGRIRAFSVASGQQTWEYATQGPVRAPAVVDGQQVLVGSDDGWLYCLDLASGKGLWRVQCGSAIGARAAITDSRVIVGTVEGKIVGIDRTGHSVVWSVSTDAAVLAPALALRDGLVTVGCDDGKQYILNAQTGETEFTVKLSGLIRRKPVVDMQQLYVGSNSGELMALDLQSQQTIWKRNIAAALTAGLVADEHYLYAGTDAGSIIAVAKKDGRVRRRWAVGAAVNGSLAINQEMVVAGLADGRVVAVRALGK